MWPYKVQRKIHQELSSRGWYPINLFRIELLCSRSIIILPFASRNIMYTITVPLLHDMAKCHRIKKVETYMTRITISITFRFCIWWILFCGYFIFFFKQCLFIHPGPPSRSGLPLAVTRIKQGSGTTVSKSIDFYLRGRYFAFYHRLRRNRIRSYM